MTAKQLADILGRIYRKWDDFCFEQFLRRFGLPESQKIKSYSRGMSMKLAIAVALSHDSKLLILDEATSGLDPIMREEILDVLLEFIKQENHSILLSSHITSDLEKIAESKAVLEGLKDLKEGNTEDGVETMRKLKEKFLLK